MNASPVIHTALATYEPLGARGDLHTLLDGPWLPGPAFAELCLCLVLFRADFRRHSRERFTKGNL